MAWGLKTSGIPRATNRFRNLQQLSAIRDSSQQLMGELWCGLEAKKFNDFSRAGVGVCVSGRGEATSLRYDETERHWG